MRDEREFPAAPERAEAELSAALRREADALPTGPAPVDAVVRAGRSRRRTRRAVVLGSAAAVAVLAALPLLPGAADPGRVEPAVPSPAPADPSGTGPRTVEPYAPVTVAPGLRLGLLPGGRQTYVLAEPEGFREAVEHAREQGLGENIRPRSISAGYLAMAGTGVERVEGAWRLPEPPRRIVVTVAGKEYPAELFTLPGDPGWGVYFLDTTALPRFDTFTVTAYDAEGEVFDRVDVGRWSDGA
ncbi:MULTISPECIES: hypothetical protein [unclassified Streptomyces]|uniref:hypothetical protein n=1 Tax=unclassified Streptomyces TaxID=2593676 RepID=UPI0022B712A8|nr:MULTISPECIES: hypothetical protein [unclassified Streptomyces]MCZ7416362.1 hypothetical protein [Streptomyces sp. WMMC897]MCZ7433828.1 hypothetical protein [Streptomyces sp. WMMC1477]